MKIKTPLSYFWGWKCYLIMTAGLDFKLGRPIYKKNSIGHEKEIKINVMDKLICTCTLVKCCPKLECMKTNHRAIYYNNYSRAVDSVIKTHRP